MSGQAEERSITPGSPSKKKLRITQGSDAGRTREEPEEKLDLEELHSKLICDIRILDNEVEKYKKSLVYDAEDLRITDRVTLLSLEDMHLRQAVKDLSKAVDSVHQELVCKASSPGSLLFTEFLRYGTFDDVMKALPETASNSGCIVKETALMARPYTIDEIMKFDEEKNWAKKNVEWEYSPVKKMEDLPDHLISMAKLLTGVPLSDPPRATVSVNWPTVQSEDKLIPQHLEDLMKLFLRYQSVMRDMAKHNEALAALIWQSKSMSRETNFLQFLELNGLNLREYMNPGSFSEISLKDC